VGYNDGEGLCGGQKRQEPTPEHPSTTCTRPAGWGTPHPGVGRCKLHGGNTSFHLKSLEKRAELQAAREQVRLWGGATDVHPAKALLDLVQWKASEVEYWRFRVAQLSDQDLLWGVSKVKTGGDDGGTTEEAKPHIALEMLRRAEQDLAAYASASLKAGVDQALVAVAKNQASQLIFVLRRLLNDPRVTVSGSVDDLVVDSIGDLELVS